MSYRHLPHTADIKIEITAPSLEQVFQDATALLRELTVGSTGVEVRERRDVTVRGDTPAEQLLQFLKEGLYLFAVDGFVPAGWVSDSITPTEIQGAFEGESFDPNRHETQPEVKAVTRHDLALDRTPDGWLGTIVFDL